MASWKSLVAVLIFCLSQALGDPVKRDVVTSPHLAPLKTDLAKAVGKYLIKLGQASETPNPAIDDLIHGIRSGNVQYRKVLPLLPELQGMSATDQFKIIIDNLGSNVPRIQKHITDLEQQLDKPGSSLVKAVNKLSGTRAAKDFRERIDGVSALSRTIQEQGISLNTGDSITTQSPETVGDATFSTIVVGQDFEDTSIQTTSSPAIENDNDSAIQTSTSTVVENNVDSDIQTSTSIFVQNNDDSPAQTSTSSIRQDNDIAAKQSSTSSIDQDNNNVAIQSTTTSIRQDNVIAPIQTNTSPARQDVSDFDKGKYNFHSDIATPTTAKPSWFAKLVNMIKQKG